MGCWRGYLSGARCRLAYGPADATATATRCLLLQYNLVPAHPGSPGQRAVKRVCVCVCVIIIINDRYRVFRLRGGGGGVCDATLPRSLSCVFGGPKDSQLPCRQSGHRPFPSVSLPVFPARQSSTWKPRCDAAATNLLVTPSPIRTTDDVPSGTHTRPGSASSTVIFPPKRFTGRAKKAGPQTHDHNSVNSGPIEKKPENLWVNLQLNGY